MELTVSLIAGLGTLLGAALVMFLGQPRSRTIAAFLGLAAGVMAAVIFCDLIPTALDQGRTQTVITGFAAGILAIALLDIQISAILGPLQRGFLKTGILIALGIALHDLPEGMAIAAGFATYTTLGFLMALTIGLHNLPEGMAMAVPLRAAGISPWRVMLLNALVSLVTPLGTFLGLFLARNNLLPVSFLSTAAAGAMLYIVVFELLPRSLQESARFTFGGLVTGVLIVVVLNSFL
ncbi:MAG: ZIP family metal transporter [Clostridia bacterium]|nr:ZIP family metal transporter [Clostridia bacterium]